MLHEIPAMLSAGPRRRPAAFLLAVCAILGSALLIGRLSMPYAGNEYVIHISIVNETDEFRNIFIFQQEDELGLMFVKVFPLAWQVFPLPGREEGIERKGYADYPASQQIGVTRDAGTAVAASDETGLTAAFRNSLNSLLAAAGSAIGKKAEAAEDKESPATFADRVNIGTLLQIASALMAKLVIKADASKGDAFAYSLDEEGGQHIARLDDKNKDGSITCRNSSESLINVDIYKDSSRLVVWPQLANGDTARFLLKRKIFFAYDDNIRAGEMIKERIEGDSVVSVDPAGYSTIEVRLTYDPDSPGRKKKWIITKQ